MRKLLTNVPGPGCQPRNSTLLRCNQLGFTNTSHLNSKFYWTNNNLNDFASFNQILFKCAIEFETTVPCTHSFYGSI